MNDVNAPGLIQIKDSQRCLTAERGVFTMPAEDGRVRCAGVASGRGCEATHCTGIDLNTVSIKNHLFVQHVAKLSAKFVERKRIRGYEPFGDRLWVHGPFPSKELNQALVDAESSMFNRMNQRNRNPWDDFEHPEDALPAVHTIEAFSPYVDYVVLGWFMKEEEILITRSFADPNDRGGFEKQVIGTGWESVGEKR